MSASGGLPPALPGESGAMTNAEDHDPVARLRQRVKQAREVHWAATHDAGKDFFGPLPDALRDLADALTDPDVYLDVSVVQAVARALLGEDVTR